MEARSLSLQASFTLLSSGYPGVVRASCFPSLLHSRKLCNASYVTEASTFLIAWRRAPEADERLTFEFLYDDFYVVVAGAQNPWARRRRIELAELVSESWALPPPGTVLGTAVTKAFRASGLELPRATVVTLPGEVRTKLLTTGRFLTIFPASALVFSAERPKLKVLPVRLPLGRLPVGIMTLKGRTLSPVAQLFADTAREVAKLLAKRKR